eukprot:7581102-Lingulodinium_polyedra.AAC.1
MPDATNPRLANRAPTRQTTAATKRAARQLRGRPGKKLSGPAPGRRPPRLPRRMFPETRRR